MKDSLAGNAKYAKMKLVAVAYGDDDPQKSTTEMEALIQKYPNLKGVISPTTVGVAAAAQVLQTQGKAKQITLTGLGTPNQMRPFIKDGTLKAFQLWSPYNEGLLTSYFAVGVKNGTIKNELVAVQDAIIEVDGVTITRSSNTIDDAIEGVTLNLYSASPDKAVSMEVSTDLSSIKSAISST